MRHLKRDGRGYPIPDGVYVDPDGRAHFTINDETKRMRHLLTRCCPICGRRLKPDYWFVGGPRSAFDPNGAYIDLPMHDECAHYALRTCPYLAAPNYGSRIDARTLSKDNPAPFLIDQTMIPERPDVFVALSCKKFTVIKGGQYVRPVRPYRQVEYWQYGLRRPLHITFPVFA
jgi:hypothetical protein